MQWIYIKWIVAARWQNGEDRTNFPELQIWRATATTGQYRKISATTLTATTNNANSVYEHTPSSPLAFQEGDILGIFQPSRAASRLRVYYVNNVGPPNYYTMILMISDSMLTPHQLAFFES